MKFQTALASVITACALFTASPSLSAHEDNDPSITEEDIEYSPEEQIVHVGEAIRLINNDPFDHKSRITEQLGGGALGHIALKDHLDKPGTSYTFKLNQPGTYEIRCLLHDGMTATIKAVE